MLFRQTFTAALILTQLFSPAFAAQSAQPVDEALQARLDSLVEQLEAQRVELHIPGMALAIVKDDEILLAKGFGETNIETGAAVTPETLFAIGSSTKAFTTALISMLVSEGRMAWDDPVTKYLPGFKLALEGADEGEEVTLRDLVCHRTGFTRMSILWAGGEASRDQILEVAAGAEPWDDFRKNFHYNNVMFLAAGEAAAKAADTDYDSLLKARLLDPLGMSSSNSSVEEAQKDPRLSLGYQWDADAEDYLQLPMRVLDTIAPAGAINSHVLDMSQWLRLQLADGQFAETRLIASDQIAEMRSPQIRVSGDTHYGLGWMLSEWEGHKVVEHGGNIDGFGAAVALMPEENLGLVLLTNVTATSLQAGVRNMVWSAVLGNEQEPAEAGSGDAVSMDYEDFVGTFIADYAHFNKAEFTVQVNAAGKLAINIPGQSLFELVDPDEEGRWYFTLTNTIAATFSRDESGRVQSLTMHQGGASFENPREGYEFPLEFDLDEVATLLGRYDDPALGAELEVEIVNNRLAVDIPGQMVFRLRAPDEEGIWWFRAVPGLGLEFHQEDGSNASSFTLHERETQRVCTRVAAALAELPDQEAVRQLCAFESRNAAVKALRDQGAVQLTGTIRMAQSGVTGRLQWTIDGPERYLLDVDFGPFGHIEEAYGDGVGTKRASMSAFISLAGVSLKQARQENPLMTFSDWSGYGDSYHITGREKLGDRQVLKLKLLADELPTMALYVDAETGDLLKLEGQKTAPGLGVSIPYSSTFEDFREVHGLRIPHRMVGSDDANGNVILTIESIETGVATTAADFVLHE